MRIAIIDCGTNTFNLLIVEKNGELLSTIFEDKVAVKIGKGGIENRIIVQEAYQRAIETMRSYASSIKNYSVEHVIATSTSAFRSTDSGPALKKDILEETGIEVQIISGDEEAEYIYEGVTWALPPKKDTTYLIMDIGGGSTEFILHRNQKILFKESYSLGASRLLEKLKPADPLSITDIKNHYNHFDDVLKDSLIASCKKHPPEILVGSSGFFDTLRHITHYKFHSELPLLNDQLNYDISIAEFVACYHLMLPLDINDRMAIRGMIPFRAEMMGVSMLLVDYIIKQTGVPQIINTSYSLKEGVLKKYLDNKKATE